VALCEHQDKWRLEVSYNSSLGVKMAQPPLQDMWWPYSDYDSLLDLSIFFLF